MMDGTLIQFSVIHIARVNTYFYKCDCNQKHLFFVEINTVTLILGLMCNIKANIVKHNYNFSIKLNCNYTLASYLIPGFGELSGACKYFCGMSATPDYPLAAVFPAHVAFIRKAITVRQGF